MIGEGVVPAATPVSHLSDEQFGWLLCAGICSWVASRAALGATEHPAIFTATNCNTCARLHLLVPFDAVAARTWVDRAITIINATRAGELLPRLAKTPTNPCCVKCSHTQRCWGDARGQ
jgi:hypothetical protein